MIIVRLIADLTAQCVLCKVRCHCIFYGPGIRYSDIFGAPGIRYSVIIKSCALLQTGHLETVHAPVADTVVHNCTIFLLPLDVRNIVQGGDPLYAAVNYKQGCGGCI